MGVDQTVHLTQLVFRSFGLLISGDVSVKQGLAGPVRITQMAGDSAKGGFNNLMVFTAFLSLNLGILNLLPFPVLDGGHLVLLLGEAVIRRPISTRIRLVIQQIGMAVLLALMILVIVNDVINIL
jgi:regulator of sigma E protease